MIRQYRLDRFNGVEWLVCEIYFKHTWTQSEVQSYLSFLDAPGDIHLGVTRDDFRHLLDEWLDQEHEEGETFFGLSQPIPAIETVPHLVLRGAILDRNRVGSLAVDFLPSVTVVEVKDAVNQFLDFTRSPHWRNTVLTQISNYGALFGSDNDS